MGREWNVNIPRTLDGSYVVALAGGGALGGDGLSIGGAGTGWTLPINKGS